MQESDPYDHLCCVEFGMYLSGIICFKEILDCEKAHFCLKPFLVFNLVLYLKQKMGTPIFVSAFFGEKYNDITFLQRSFKVLYRKLVLMFLVGFHE